ncbi:MAG: hypothetical protein KC501_22600 [Myxococcales bacterium]|nr:hypothetical protein [Myxococcales bacterium]
MTTTMGVGTGVAGSASVDDAPAKPAVASIEPVVVEACDGTRSAPAGDPGMLGCARWHIVLREGGVPKGLIVADGYDALIAERERQLAFAREHARFFDAPLDPRFADPGPPVCSTCELAAPQGRWGEGQVLGDGPALRAVTAAQGELTALASAIDEHLPRLRDVARLARESTTSKAAKDHAKQLHQAVLELAELRLALDDAAILRSEKLATDAGRSARTRIDALAASSSALAGALGKLVAKAHGGSYAEEGAGADGPHLEVVLDGATVTATYKVGGAKSTWFEGTVGLDGAIAGRSLLAPESGQLSCKAHTVDCGYVYVDAMLRFSERPVDGGKTQQVAELWFRRAKWVMAKPFIR